MPELKGKTWAEGMVYGQALQAVKGDTAAASFVADHGEGKVKDELEFTGDFGVAVREAYARARGAK